MEIRAWHSAVLTLLCAVFCSGMRCPMPMGNFPMIESESCEVYWKCRGGRPIAEQCKPGQQFHYMKGLCLPQQFVGCIMQRKIFIKLQQRPQPRPAPQIQPAAQQQSPQVILYPIPWFRPTKRPTPAPTQAPTQAPQPQAPAKPKPPFPFPFPQAPPCGAPPAPPCGGGCGAPPAPPCGGQPFPGGPLSPGPCSGGSCGPPGPFGPVGQYQQQPAQQQPFINSPAGFFSFSQNGQVPPFAQRLLRNVLAG